jgi:hypothetical protein
MGFLSKGPNKEHVSRVYCDLHNSQGNDYLFERALQLSLARYGPDVVAAAVGRLNAEMDAEMAQAPDPPVEAPTPATIEPEPEASASVEVPYWWD